MDHVIQKHFPVRQKSRSLKNRLTLKTQLPVFFPGFIRSSLQRPANLGCALIESLHQLGGRLERQGCDSAFGEIQFRRSEYRQPEARKLSQVRRQLAQRHRLGMRRKFFFVGWNPLQGGARLFHFVIQFSQQQFTNRHEDLRGLEYNLDHRGVAKTRTPFPNTARPDSD